MMSAGVAMSLIVSLQVWAKPCTCNPTLPGLGTPTVTPPPHYPRILIEGHSIRARPRAHLPLQRDTFPTHRLMTEHPPVLRDPNKQVVFDVACPAGTVHEGRVRLRARGRCGGRRGVARELRGPAAVHGVRLGALCAGRDAGSRASRARRAARGTACAP